MGDIEILLKPKQPKQQAKTEVPANAWSQVLSPLNKSSSARDHLRNDHPCEGCDFAAFRGGNRVRCLKYKRDILPMHKNQLPCKT
jgi:hypothetical protein